MLTALDGVLLELEHVSFYWADAADGRVVSVTFTLNNDPTPCIVTATFNIKDPPVSYPVSPTPFGTVQFDAVPPTNIHLRNASLLLPRGIYPNAMVSLPTGFPNNGRWAFWQLVMGTVWVKILDPEQCWLKTSNDEYYLDSANANIPFTTGWTSPFPAGGDGWYTGTSAGVYDSPGWSDLTNVQQITIEYWLQTCIMFLPHNETASLAGGQSAWVPLRRVFWNVNFCAENDTMAGWYFTPQVGDRQSLGAWDGSDRNPPEWPGVFQLLDFDTDADCPPPCE